MTKPVVGFGDPLSAAKLDVDAERDAGLLLPTPPTFLTGLEVATVMPASAPPGRLLVVRQGPWTEYTPFVSAVCRVRFVAWDPDPDVCWDIASWIHARLLARRGDSDAVSYRYDSGPLRGRDPDFPDSPITAFAMRVRMRPAIL